MCVWMWEKPFQFPLMPHNYMSGLQTHSCQCPQKLLMPFCPSVWVRGNERNRERERKINTKVTRTLHWAGVKCPLYRNTHFGNSNSHFPQIKRWCLFQIQGKPGGWACPAFSLTKWMVLGLENLVWFGFCSRVLLFWKSAIHFISLNNSKNVEFKSMHHQGATAETLSKTRIFPLSVERAKRRVMFYCRNHLSHSIGFVA